MPETFRIGVECFMTNPPRPLHFGVTRDGKTVAFLTREQIVEALARFDALAADRAKADEARDSSVGRAAGR